MKALLKEHGWKVCVCLIWYISADYPFRNLPFYWQILCWFLFIIALDIIIWTLKPEKKSKENNKKHTVEEFEEFKQKYLEDNKDEIISVYDRLAGLNDGVLWLKQKDSKIKEENNICWNDITDKEKSDFLFLPSHQKSAAKPVSKELEEASKEWLKPQLDKSYASYGEGKMMELTRFDGYAMLDAVEFGAKWKERQFEKNRIAHCDKLTAEQAQTESDFVTKHIKENNRTPTLIDAIEYGMRLQKEQMMKDAVDGIVFSDILEGIMIRSHYFKSNGLKLNDKVKIAILKEE